AYGEALPEDDAGAEEADAGDDLGRDAARVGADDGVAARQEIVEAVGADHGEQGRAAGDEHVRAQPGGLLVELALEADHAAERGGDREADEGVVPADGR